MANTHNTENAAATNGGISVTFNHTSSPHKIWEVFRILAQESDVPEPVPLHSICDLGQVR